MKGVFDCKEGKSLVVSSVVHCCQNLTFKIGL